MGKRYYLVARVSFLNRLEVKFERSPLFLDSPFSPYEKERFDQLRKKDPRMYVKEITPYVKDGKRVDKEYRYRNEVTTLVKKDVKICGKEILSCCKGEFPKSS